MTTVFLLFAFSFSCSASLSSASALCVVQSLGQKQSHTRFISPTFLTPVTFRLILDSLHGHTHPSKACQAATADEAVAAAGQGGSIIILVFVRKLLLTPEEVSVTQLVHLHVHDVQDLRDARDHEEEHDDQQDVEHAR